MTNQDVANQTAAMHALMSSSIALAVLAGVALLAVLCWCRIFAKAGYSWAMGLLMFVPLVNLIMILVLAFSEWPIQRRLRNAGTTYT